MKAIVTQQNHPELCLPFKMYHKAKSAKIVQARIFSLDVHNMNSQHTWHQLVVKYNLENPKDDEKDITQYNVLERLEINAENDSWRFAYIEN